MRSKCVKTGEKKKKGASAGRLPLSSFPRFLLTAGSMFSGQPAQAWRGICQRSGLNPSRPYSRPPGSVVWESASVYAGLVSRQVCSCLSYWQCWKRTERKRDENIICTVISMLSLLTANVQIQCNVVLHQVLLKRMNVDTMRGSAIGLQVSVFNTYTVSLCLHHLRLNALRLQAPCANLLITAKLIREINNNNNNNSISGSEEDKCS